MKPKLMIEHTKINRSKFGEDPFGYSSLARVKWGILQELHGANLDLANPATSDELKDPVLWMAHANSLSEAATVIVKTEPSFQNMQVLMRGVCDSQFCAIGLMLIGYSLEVCLKAMHIMNEGIEKYTIDEKKHKHHKLHLLARFIPELSDKELAILELLSHFTTWAGRYPDPGMGWETNAEKIFDLSEQHQISAKDLFSTSAKVMSFAKIMVEKYIEDGG